MIFTALSETGKPLEPGNPDPVQVGAAATGAGGVMSLPSSARAIIWRTVALVDVKVAVACRFRIPGSFSYSANVLVFTAANKELPLVKMSTCVAKISEHTSRELRVS